MEPQLKDAIGELASETMAMRILPFAIHDLKRDVLVRWPGVKTQNPEVFVVEAGIQEILRRGAFVDEIGVEDVELVTLDDFGRRVVEVVMGLVVFVPLEAGVHAVEEARLARTVFVGPQVHFSGKGHFDTELSFVAAHALFGTPHEGVLRAFIRVTCWNKSCMCT